MSLTLKERGLRIWLVCCGSIRGLIISFAPNGSYCRSRFRYCRSRFRSKRVIWSLTLKERNMHIWLVYCGSIPSIDYFFRSKRVILSLTLKERGIHIWLVCCHSRFCYCRSRFRSKRVTLSLTLKERGIQSCISGLLVVADAIFRSYTDRKLCLQSVQTVRIDKPLCLLRLNNTWYVPLTRYNFPIVYGPKTALTIRTNRTYRQTAVTPSLE